MAALAVHVPAEDWRGGGVVTWLQNEMNSHPGYIPGFMELLTVLPEVSLIHMLQIYFLYYFVSCDFLLPRKNINLSQVPLLVRTTLRIVSTVNFT